MGIQLRGQKNSGHHSDINKVSHRFSIQEPETATFGLAPCHGPPIPFGSGKVAASRRRGIVKRRGGGIKKVLRPRAKTEIRIPEIRKKTEGRMKNGRCSRMREASLECGDFSTAFVRGRFSLVRWRAVLWIAAVNAPAARASQATGITARTAPSRPICRGR